MSRGTRAGWWLLALAIAVTAAVYVPGLKGGWLFDDYPNIVNNPGIQIQHADIPDLARAALSSPSSEFKRPMASLTFALNYLGSGLNTYWWKVTNVAIHLINGILLFLLSRLLLRLGLPAIRRSGAPPEVDTRHIGIVAALIAGGWMLLPINLTAVLYIVQRMTSMANVFVLLGLIGYVVGRMHMRDPTRRRGAAFVLSVGSLVVATAIGFTAKETAIMLPLYAFLIEWVLFRFRATAPELAPQGTVIPPKAGIHSGPRKKGKWIPASAGMTGTASGGRRGTTSGGMTGTASGGMAGTASGGRTGTASGGRTGTASGGMAGTASGGRRGTASGGMTGAASGGMTGAASGGMTGKSKRDWLVIGLFVVILVLPLIAGLIWLAPGTFSAGNWAKRDFTLGTRLLSEARIVSGYILWTLIPTPDALSFYHDGYVVSQGLFTPWTTLPCIILIAVLVALAIWLRKRAPLAALGLLLFFGAHTLTGTILPLELVYEHRNYFASFGLLLVVVPILAALPHRAGFAGAAVGRDRNRGKSQARAETSRRSRPTAAPTHALRAGLPLALPRYVLLGGLLLLWIVQTAMTSYAWGDDIRLAQALAARAPDSPRAQYSLGRTYIVASHYDPNSIFTKAAYAPLERAAALPDSSILPEQALIFLNARLHRPIKAAWWDSMIAKLKAHDPGVQDVSSLAALTKCAREGACKLPESRMLDAFLAALGHPHPSSRLLAIYGDYAWNVLGDHALGERMVAEAVQHDLGEPAYHITLTRMLIVQGRYDAARQQIQALENINIGGRLDGSIAGLRALLPPSSSQ